MLYGWWCWCYCYWKENEALLVLLVVSSAGVLGPFLVSGGVVEGRMEALLSFWVTSYSELTSVIWECWSSRRNYSLGFFTCCCKDASVSLWASSLCCCFATTLSSWELNCGVDIPAANRLVSCSLDFDDLNGFKSCWVPFVPFAVAEQLLLLVLIIGKLKVLLLRVIFNGEYSWRYEWEMLNN